MTCEILFLRYSYLMNIEILPSLRFFDYPGYTFLSKNFKTLWWIFDARAHTSNSIN